MPKGSLLSAEQVLQATPRPKNKQTNKNTKHLKLNHSCRITGIQALTLQEEETQQGKMQNCTTLPIKAKDNALPHTREAQTRGWQLWDFQGSWGQHLRRHCMYLARGQKL